VKSQEYLGAEDNFHEIYTVESSREPALYESFNKKKLRSVRFLGQQIHFNNDFLSIKRKILFIIRSDSLILQTFFNIHFNPCAIEARHVRNLIEENLNKKYKN